MVALDDDFDATLGDDYSIQGTDSIRTKIEWLAGPCGGRRQAEPHIKAETDEPSQLLDQAVMY